jgi:hypothetical protein
MSQPLAGREVASFDAFVDDLAEQIGALFDRDLSEADVPANSRAQIVEMILAWVAAKA